MNQTARAPEISPLGKTGAGLAFPSGEISPGYAPGGVKSMTPRMFTPERMSA